MNKLIRRGLLAILMFAWLAAEGSLLAGTFSVDFQGPTATAPAAAPWWPPGAPIDEGQILTTAPPGPLGPNVPLLGLLPPPGIMVDSAPGSPIGSVPGGLGIVPGAGGFVELDALSYGHDTPPSHQQGPGFVFFSVDEYAVGIPLTPVPPNVWSEGPTAPPPAPMESAADVFTYLGPFGPVPIPPGPVFGNIAVSDGNGLPSLSGAVYPGVGLIEPNPPTPMLLPDPGDNLDALDIDTTLADVLPPGRIYFSLDSAFPDPLEVPPANTGTAVANGFVGGDVLVTTVGAPAPAVYAAAAALGLDLISGPDSDDLDALALWDNGDGIFMPGVDLIFFSVRRGSAVIGLPDSIFGAPIVEGDILVPPAIGGGSPFPGIWVAAEALGLWTMRPPFGPTEFGPFSDDLDALDVVPEPSTMLLLMLGGLSLLGYAWRRRGRQAV